MHPQIVAMAAAEHVKDMQAVATRGRRAREARRARRGAITISAATNGGCPPLTASSRSRRSRARSFLARRSPRGQRDSRQATSRLPR